MKRRLAAILAADVVGYTTLMGADEAGTLRRLTELRQLIIEPLIKAHHGRVVKLMGDGFLVEFSSVVDAVACAVAWQTEVTTREAIVDKNKQLAFRIGVNLGDIMVEGEDIHGDGVNIAARLESGARPGGISISEVVYQSVKAKLDLAFDDLGPQQFKNVAESVHVYRVQLTPGRMRQASATKRGWQWPALAAGIGLLMVVAGLMVWQKPWEPRAENFASERIAQRLPDKPSIAVLPFNNMSGEAEQEYFVDGFTEDLITDLSKISGLAVIARNSTFTYKGRAVDVRQVGKDLGVRYVLEGSVRRAGNQMRFNAQLVDSSSGEHIWADRFDRQLDNVFELQDEVIKHIISILKIELTGSEEARISSDFTNSIKAYDHFLLGQRKFFEFSREGNAAARREYEAAIEIDPMFARAVANIGWTYARDFIDGWSENPEQSLDTALLWISKAIELNQELPQAYWIKGQIHLFRKEHSEALAAGKKAVTLNPNYPDGKILLARILSFSGRPEEGIQLIEEAKQLNPLFPMQYDLNLGIAYFTAGNFAKAVKALKQAELRNPAAQRVRMWLAASYARSGDLENAKWEADELIVSNPGFSIMRIAASVPYRDEIHRQEFVVGLQKSGLPD